MGPSRTALRGVVVLAFILAVSGAWAADTSKVLRVAINAPENGFDPQAASDLYSNYVNREIFDPLYRYDYLARPYKVIPNTAVALPDISSDGKTWTIRIKPGIYFSDDPAFKGKKRELTATDYVYSFKRLIDPALRSNNAGLLDARLVGAKDAIEKARKTGKFDYDAPFEGAQAIDRYTLRLKLNFSAYDLLVDLTSSFTGAVAREVVAAYGDPSGWVMEHPVGTGPYYLKSWRRAQQIVLEANPNFREMLFPGSDKPEDQALVAKMKGKKLPVCGRVEINVIEESNPRLLAFEKGDLDYIVLPTDLVTKVLNGDRLKPEYVERGIVLGRGVQPTVVYTYFNMEDPIVGGYTKEKIALRRAISMAYNTNDEIHVIRLDQALPATQPIPPNVVGHDPDFKGNVSYDVAGAKALLDKFGYVDRDGDGWRDMPDGKPLKLVLASDPSAIYRPFDELWKRSMDAIGIRIEFTKQKFPDTLKQGLAGQLQMWGLANTLANDAGLGMLDLLYGPHKGMSNLGRFDLPEFNALYEQAERIPNGPERVKLFRRMSQLVTAYAPWVMHTYRFENVVVQPWVIGYKYNTFDQHPWMYYDLDLEKRRTATR
ncbi:MAG TPA: ABC transporter substrate-binding protein [Casimicrobiaceae bacterium]|jgi:ABC-type transport system substrate-binding protein|nr:ABC transporter substrate-binding protein [Casimicrobiaceae bacterium]